MISVEDLAGLLNNEMTNKAMVAIQELWEDEDEPFDIEHPDISFVLEKVCEILNEKLGVEDFEPREE